MSCAASLLWTRACFCSEDKCSQNCEGTLRSNCFGSVRRPCRHRAAFVGRPLPGPCFRDLSCSDSACSPTGPCRSDPARARCFVFRCRTIVPWRGPSADLNGRFGFRAPSFAVDCSSFAGFLSTRSCTPSATFAGACSCFSGA